MLLTATVERTARQICEHEWRELRRHGAHEPRQPRGPGARRGDESHGEHEPRDKASSHTGPQHCPDWLLPDLLALIAENHHKPVSELAPMIRRLVEEHNFCEEAGDPMIDESHDELVDDYVQLFVRALEQVRRCAAQENEWSHLPVTPQMYG